MQGLEIQMQVYQGKITFFSPSLLMSCGKPNFHQIPPSPFLSGTYAYGIFLV